MLLIVVSTQKHHCPTIKVAMILIIGWFKLCWPSFRLWGDTVKDDYIEIRPDIMKCHKTTMNILILCLLGWILDLKPVRLIKVGEYATCVLHMDAIGQYMPQVTLIWNNSAWYLLLLYVMAWWSIWRYIQRNNFYK